MKPAVFGAALLGLYVACQLLGRAIFAALVAPETLLFFVIAVVALGYQLLWRRGAAGPLVSSLFPATERVSSSAAFLSRVQEQAADASGSARALHGLCSLLLSLTAPVLDARLTFWLCELLREKNPFPVLSHPVASATVGSVAPALMHLRRVSLEQENGAALSSSASCHFYAVDFVLADSDARVSIAALSSSVHISAKSVNAAGCLYFRVDALTGEVAVCLRDEPMFKVGEGAEMREEI